MHGENSCALAKESTVPSDDAIPYAETQVVSAMLSTTWLEAKVINFARLLLDNTLLVGLRVTDGSQERLQPENKCSMQLPYHEIRGQRGKISS